MPIFLSAAGMRIFVYGAVLFLGSNLLGHGIAYHPSPIQGLLVAGTGMLICTLGVSRARGSESEHQVLIALRWLLATGALTLVGTLGYAVLQPFHDLCNLRWGATPPPTLFFGVLYGTVSLFGTLIVDSSLRARGCDQCLGRRSVAPLHNNSVTACFSSARNPRNEWALLA